MMMTMMTMMVAKWTLSSPPHLDGSPPALSLAERKQVLTQPGCSAVDDDGEHRAKANQDTFSKMPAKILQT